MSQLILGWIYALLNAFIECQLIIYIDYNKYNSIIKERDLLPK
jgi:hypothetical protein